MRRLAALLFLLQAPAASAELNEDEIRSSYCGDETETPPGREITVLNEAAAQGNDGVARAVLRVVDLPVFTWSYCHGAKDLFLFLSRNVPAENKEPVADLAKALKHLLLYRPKAFWSVRELLDRGMPLDTPVIDQLSGWQTLLRATMEGSERPDFELIDYLLARGASVLASTDPTAQDGPADNPGTVLHAVLRTLQQASTSPDDAQPSRSTLENDYLRILDRFILAAGADRKGFVNQSDGRGETPLSIITPYPKSGDNSENQYEEYKAYYSGGVENTPQGKAIDKLLAAGADINAPFSNDAASVLRAAVAAGNPYMARFLLSRGADPAGWEEQVARLEKEMTRSGSYSPEGAQALLEEMRGVFGGARKR